MLGSGSSKQPAFRDVSPGGDLDGRNAALYVFVTRQAATPTSGCLPSPVRGRCGSIVKDSCKKKEKKEAIHHWCRAEIFGSRLALIELR